MKWLLNLFADFNAKLEARRIEDKLDAMREEERLLKAYIQKLRRQHLALGDEIRALEAQILQGVRL